MLYPFFFTFLCSRKCGLFFLKQIEQRLKITLPLPKSLRWKIGVIDEMCFWNSVFQKEIIDPKVEFLFRMNPNTFFTEKIESLLPINPTVKILDVGAGPLTSLEKKSTSHIVEITAVDALAKEYDMILRKYNIKPPIRTQLAKAEKLSEQFSENTFDLVHARNSIDHCFSPEKAILEMGKTVKQGCYVFMEHYANEAENENYRGFHQWNFLENHGDFIIKSKKETINFTKKYQVLFDIQCTCDENNLLTVKILKK